MRLIDQIYDEMNGLIELQINIKAMEQQQKRKLKISQILDDNRQITLEQLLFVYSYEKISLQEIRKKLTLIQEEQNTSEDMGYQLRLTGKRVLALNGQLVLDVVTRFETTIINLDSSNQKQDHSLLPFNLNNHPSTQSNFKSPQQSSKEQHSSHSPQHSQKKGHNNQFAPQTLQTDEKNETQPQLQQKNQSSIKTPNQQNQFKNIFAPQVQRQQSQLLQFQQQAVKKQSKPPEDQNKKTQSKYKLDLKTNKQNKSTQRKTNELPQFLLDQIKPRNPQVKSKHINEQHQVHLQVKQKHKAQFQVNQFSVLDSKRNIQRQKILQKQKQLQIKKQKKQKQKLALLKLKMNSQLHPLQAEPVVEDPTLLPHQHQSPIDLKNPSKQQQNNWKQQDRTKQKNPHFDDFKNNEFDQDPQVVTNFQNQDEIDQLSQDLKNHKNPFDHRGFFIANDSDNLGRAQSFYSKQYQTLKNKLNRYLIPAYFQYVLQAYSTEVIFDKDQIFKKPLMDLTLFLKFYKDFNLKELLKVPDATKIFKKTALNHLWIDTQKFISVCHNIIETKSSQNVKEPTYVNTEEQILERTKKFIKQFNKERIKQRLKIQKKDAWDQILKEYQNRGVNRTVEKKHQNKGEVVDKFLERNFDLELPKWKEKKDLNKLNKKPANDKSRMQNKTKQNQIQKIRDEKTISIDIQKLRSQSQKSLKVLKNLFNQKFDEQLRSLVNSKSGIHQSQESILSSPKNISNKAPLHKNKHKNTVSAYKEIEQFINSNIKIMKTQKTLLGRNLKINEDQPFLNAYFSRQMKNTQSKNQGKKQVVVQLKLSPSKQKHSSARSPKTNNIASNNPSPSQKYSIENNLEPKMISNGRNQFISLQKLDKIRKIHSNSSPSNKAKIQISPNRSNSMKKIGKDQKVRQKMSPSETSGVSLPSVKKIGDVRAKLNQVQNELVNRKLYDFLLNNKEHQNDRVEEKFRRIKKYNNIESIKTEAQQNYLMESYRQEVYELFKNFVRRGQEEEKIVLHENEKRKGYLKGSKTPNYI